jgi:DNA-binding PadR family transcriptional regulator
MRRGDVRTALLLALVDGAAHGYELSTRLEQKSGGAWRPSPGSVYPTLQLLADEGLVEAEERDGKRIYALTKSGKTEAAERGKLAGGVPWQQATDEDADGLRAAVHDLKLAARQVSSAGSEAQRLKAREIVVEARRQLYELLAKG